MYRGRPWTIRQYAGFGTPEATNERFKFLLSQGQPGLSTAFDLPTQMGLDSDDERAAGEVGQVGVAIDSLADMETVFDGIPLDRVSTSMTINAPAPGAGRDVRRGRRQAGRPAREGLRHRPERRAEGIRRTRDVHLPAEALAAAGGRPDRLVRAATRRASTRSRCPATTCARPARPPSRRSPSRSRTRSPTSRRCASAASTSTRSRRGSRGSSTRTSTSSRRSPSTARCGACGRGS